MALVDYDSDGSDRGDDGPPRPAAGAAVALPSAQELLRKDAGGATARPDFLAQRSKAEVDYKALSTALEQQREAAVALEGGPIGQAQVGEGATKLAGAKRARSDAGDEGQAQPADASSGDAAAAGAATASTSAAVERDRDRKEKERVAFKERAKHQRLSGQSGIGSDFRTWRSDEEMHLRQQFDG